jgi:hypothetical protein
LGKRNRHDKEERDGREFKEKNGCTRKERDEYSMHPHVEKWYRPFSFFKE